MIQTTTPVSYDPVDNTKTAIVKAKVVSANRNDLSERYTITVEEWREEEYTENVAVYDENGEPTGEMEEQTFIKNHKLRNHTRSMTFTEVDQLTGYLDSEYNINETGCARRKVYTQIGHLLINNQENVRNTSWEFSS